MYILAKLVSIIKLIFLGKFKITAALKMSNIHIFIFGGRNMLNGSDSTPKNKPRPTLIRMIQHLVQRFQASYRSCLYFCKLAFVSHL